MKQLHVSARYQILGRPAVAEGGVGLRDAEGKIFGKSIFHALVPIYE